MSILVGVKCVFAAIPGDAKASTFFCVEAAKDIHEAARFMWKWNHENSPFHVRYTEAAEFHDEETGRTWSVYQDGRTKGDYRRERSEEFINRWRD